MKRKRLKMVQQRYAVRVNDGFALNHTDAVDVYNLRKTACLFAKAWAIEGYDTEVVKVRVTVEEVQGG